ncbi:MAG: OadG family protein [Clostridiales bacterium]|nr:OadG family protein [Clostridiales bacterium]
MDWKTVGQSIPEITTRDLAAFRLAPEEAEQLARQYNRALFNTNNDGADVAIISLKKIITVYPDWGEPSLMFGICVAQCEEYHRALSCFEHALTSGLHSQEMTELAQFCLSEAKKDMEEAQAAVPDEKTEESPLKALSSAITRQESPMVAESENRERIHMQAPILLKAPRKPTKRRLATEKEIRDALMQTTSSNGEIPDDEIEVDFPKTPAEKMRMTLIGVVVFLILVGLFFACKYLIIPAISKSSEKAKAVDKVEYLESKLEENAGDPEVAAILSEYHEKYGQ